MKKKEKKKQKKKSGLFGSFADDELPLPKSSKPQSDDKKVSVGEYKFEKGVIVYIESIGHRIQFTAHSHKRVKKGGKSPLIMYFTTQFDGEEPVEQRTSIRTDRRKDFELLGNIHFKIKDYEYGRFMKLSVFVENDYFEKLEEKKKSIEVFKKNLRILPYDVVPIILEYFDFYFHPIHESKNILKLFHGYFNTDLQRKIFLIFTSVKYKKWPGEKISFLHLKGIKHFSFHESVGLYDHEIELERMKDSLVSISKCSIHTLANWKSICSMKNIRMLREIYVNHANIPPNKVIKCLNLKKDLKVVELEAYMRNSKEVENIKLPEDLDLQLPKLKTLKLKGFRYGEGVFLSPSPSNALSNLRHLYINYWCLSSAQIKNIVQLGRNNLRILELVICDLSNLGHRDLNDIFNLPQLRKLNFSWSKNLNKMIPTPNTVFRITDKNSQLEDVDLGETGPINVEFVRCICLGLKNLRSINLVNNSWEKKMSKIANNPEICVWKRSTTSIKFEYSMRGLGVNELRKNFIVRNY